MLQKEKQLIFHHLVFDQNYTRKIFLLSMEILSLWTNHFISCYNTRNALLWPRTTGILLMKKFIIIKFLTIFPNSDFFMISFR